MGLVNISLVCLVALIAAHVTEVMSICCHHRAGICADGTRSTPYCGYGPCNIFGCACEGGRCRTGPCHRRRRSTDETDENRYGEDLIAIFKQLDSNNDGEVTKSEMASSGVPNASNVEKNFAEVDRNNDGKITLDEVRSIYREEL